MKKDIKWFVERAIKGGWKPKDREGRHEKPIVDVEVGEYTMTVWFRKENGGGDFVRQAIDTVLLDPEAWKAVGKVEGWDLLDENHDCDFMGCNSIEHRLDDGWKKNMHRMIDHIAEGKTIESFIETL